MANNRKRLLAILFFTAVTTLPAIAVAANYWINETVQVPAGGLYYWSGTLYNGNRLQGSFTSGGGDIKFYILDGTNFAKYQNGQSFTTYYSRQAIQVPEVAFTVPYDGTWFVLLDNKYSWWTSKAVTVTLTVNAGGSTSGPGGPDYTEVFILGLLGLAGFCALGWWVSNSQRKNAQSPLS